ncbi:MAG: chloride channel protein [Propionibacteriaceae bacterium]|nr:chloride channel protein [Propionibacteriaceae bacterium]
MIQTTSRSRFAASFFVAVCYSLLIGAMAAAVVWAFMRLVNLVTGWLWTDLAEVAGWWFYPVIVCALGGLVIGLGQRFWGSLPAGMDEVLGEVKATGRYSYAGLWKMLLAAFLPLVLGGSIGPEAGLAGVIAALCTWAGDRLKRAGLASEGFAEAGTAAALTAIFNAPLFGLLAPVEGGVGEAGRNQPTVLPKSAKMTLYLAAIGGALLAMYLLNEAVGGANGLPRFGQTTWHPSDVLKALPLVLIGVAAGWIFYAASKLLGSLASRMPGKNVLKAVIAGVVLGLAGAWLPLAMFSGESQLTVLMSDFATIGAGALIVISVVKLVLTPLCISFGWRGGHIFPVIFAGVGLGYAASLLTGLDPVLCVTVVATATSAAIMRRPLLTVAIMLLCFPAVNMVFMIVAAVVAAAIPLPGPICPVAARDSSSPASN